MNAVGGRLISVGMKRSGEEKDMVTWKGGSRNEGFLVGWASEEERRVELERSFPSDQDVVGAWEAMLTALYEEV